MMTSPPRRPATVLLVDDEAGLRRVLERFLERHGYRVLSAGTAEAAYDLLASEMADALLLSSQRVEPARLLASGYRFLHPDLEPALRHLLDSAAS